ncbi:HMG box-containing protein 4 [Sphaeramia orbicularis]|uniref:HMG box-containing protein 4 n=1 Tax=Sphaeramia orbicularis TaxID=375764 RepID=UPI00117C3F07|nr:HMG box-containing protein 4-like [Sphaeramia orbicularis]
MTQQIQEGGSKGLNVTQLVSTASFRPDSRVTLSREADPVDGRSQKKRSYKEYLMDVEDLDKLGSGVEEDDTVLQGSLSKKRRRSGSSGAESDCGAESCAFKWMESAEEEENCPDWLYEDNQHNMTDSSETRPAAFSSTPLTHRPHPVVSIPPSPTSVSSMITPLVFGPVTSTDWPISSMCSPTGSAWDSLRFSPGCGGQGPISAAAYLHLLGESLALIGHHLQETNKLVCVSSSVSLLLDSLLCALAPLISLTSQIPELRSCLQHTLDSTLENISYVMPGL